MLMTRTERRSPLLQLGNEMDRLFSVLDAGSFFDLPCLGWSGRECPAINLWEEGENLVAEVEVPGLKLDDLEVSVLGNELTIKGRWSDATSDGVTHHRRERSVGAFSRVLRLPVEIDADRVRAALRHGVLTITLPKVRAALPQKIEVKE